MRSKDSYKFYTIKERNDKYLPYAIVQMSSEKEAIDLVSNLEMDKCFIAEET